MEAYDDTTSLTYPTSVKPSGTSPSLVPGPLGQDP